MQGATVSQTLMRPFFQARKGRVSIRRDRGHRRQAVFATNLVGATPAEAANWSSATIRAASW